MAACYDICPAPEGWTVYDTATGIPAVVSDEPQVRLSLEAADDLADLLNRLNSERLASVAH